MSFEAWRLKMPEARVSNVLIRGQNREICDRGQCDSGNDERDDPRRLQPTSTLKAREPAVKSYPACGEQHRIGRCGIVHAAMHREHEDHDHGPGSTKRAPALAGAVAQ